MILARESVFRLGYFSGFFVFVVIALTTMLYCTFRRISLLSFYIFFESRLIPTLFLILGWGYQPERVQAGIYLLFYTLLASLPLLVGILFIYNSFFNLGARWGGWSTPRPASFTPRKDRVPVVQEAGWASGPVWTVAENFPTSGIRSPNRPAIIPAHVEV